MLSAALLGAVTVSGCKTEGNFPSAAKANAPIPPKLLADIAEKNMDVSSPILVRVFKSESELEVWKKDRNGQFALLKTYPICKWSGDLGPKIKEGDRQAPEGFYDITPGQMNPNSQFYLAFNMGYPNAFDRAHDRTGAHLMVHGDCSSRGCYAMSNEQISEIFALGRESFFGGQKSFQVQAYPFRMTAANMAKHRNNPNMPFWRMLKEGNDHFEVTRLEPKVDVCEKRYVFNAAAPGGNFSPMSFSPRGRCPVYEVPREIAEAVQSKQRNDELQFAQLAARNTPTAPIKSGRDGGMHPTFIAKLRPHEIIDERGNAKLIVDPNNPGPMVAFSASSPSEDEVTNSAAVSAPVQTADVPLPRNAPQTKIGMRPAPELTFAEKIGNFFRGGSREPEAASTRVASVQPMAPATPAAPAPQRETVRTKVSRMIGLRGSSEKQAEVPTRAAPSASASRTPSETPKMKTAAAPAAGEAPAPQPAPTATPASQPTGSVMSGSQPIPQASSFESRFGAFR
ncbi:L,D-transpeptidase family protein [Pseudorhodoplanes sinuspersici]|uniref:L,D-TPase catalytic domain-containing protein n=1 Tax=Pseudorhodoplanes sinuspersici TaxID=1235591 RepID=A0A1W6ZZW9_9HYPH|nr:murein L,D-transpeptidase family protein [Pseudorhodoplanes sinuspersici]ARQ02883.1 hypothetical protein CAK95_10460 [Pseudorhodoplanes sinuspersici]RKE70409.1 murein L,D-transpeptidase YafK [Pseudorhodoplanes sinuspersici]